MFEIWGFSRNLHWKSHITIFIFKDFFLWGRNFTLWRPKKIFKKNHCNVLLRSFFGGKMCKKSSHNLDNEFLEYFWIFKKKKRKKPLRNNKEIFFVKKRGDEIIIIFDVHDTNKKGPPPPPPHTRCGWILPKSNNKPSRVVLQMHAVLFYASSSSSTVTYESQAKT
jgi:hypothetical protein